jgi:PAS domain S-box-containing protein
MNSLDALFEFATEGIIISDETGVINKINPSAEKLFGYERGELVLNKIEVLVPTRFEHTHQHHRANFNVKPTPRVMGKGFELFGKKKDGSEFPLEISLSPYSVDGKLHVIAFIIDISERRKAQENIKRVNSELELKVEERTKILKETLYELEASKEELSIALEREKELNDLKSRFVTMASHEFRTPLSTILTSASLIGKYKTSEEEEKRLKHVERIKSAVSNMTLILNDFLSAGRLDEGKISVKLVSIDIPDFISGCLAEISNVLKKGQEIEYHHTGPNFFVTDKQFIKNIIINLVSNSSKFSAENKSIQIITHNDIEELQFQIKDQGMGIPIEEQRNLFQRFFRAKNAMNVQGTGLGLSIVEKYVELLRGTITFESELNKGTTFYINLSKQNEDNTDY